MSKEIKGIDPKSYGSFDKVMDKARKVSRYVLPGVVVALTASCTPEMINALAKTVETPDVSPLPSNFTKTPAPLSTEANYELTPTVQNPATQELTLVSPTEVATEMPTVTSTPEPTEEIREIRPLTDISGNRYKDRFRYIGNENGYLRFGAVGVISGYGTNETEYGILNDYILIDIGKGKFKVLTTNQFPLSVGFLNGTSIDQRTTYSVINFEELLPSLDAGKGIKFDFVGNFDREGLCHVVMRRGGSSAFTDEECIKSLNDEIIGTYDLNYLNSVMNGETVTSEPVVLGVVFGITINNY